MTATGPFFGIIPSGGRRPLAFAILSRDGDVLSAGEASLDAVVVQAAAQTPVWAAIGSASHLGGPQGRACETQLRQRGIDTPLTPADESDCPGWVRRGLRLYRRLEGLGFRPCTGAASPCRWLEASPAGVFAVLLEREPLPRGGLEGRLQRQLALYERGVQTPDPMDFFEEVTRHKLLRGTLPLDRVYPPAVLDALAAAYTAWLAGMRPQEILWLGLPEEGQIALPAH